MKNILIWFKDDLRISDNEAIFEARSNNIIPIFIFDEKKYGEAAKCWLHYSLEALNKKLSNNLNFFKGNAFEAIKLIIKENDIDEIYWNLDTIYTKEDEEIKEYLQEQKISYKNFYSSTLFKPETILNNDKKPYKVFSHFYKNLHDKLVKNSIEVIVNNEKLNTKKIKSHNIEAYSLESLKLLPKKSWYKKLVNKNNIGEENALKNLQNFIDNNILSYKNSRDYPSLDKTSKLSANLRFGEISPRQIYYYINSYKNVIDDTENIDFYIKEIAWREFSYYLLYHFPEMSKENFNKKFDKFPWENNDLLLKKWQKGQTGIPIIDAGMRELWQTGFMHNRVRMITASFLTKHLLIDWRDGAKWFYDCLLDADIASNSVNWQWVAGSGVDAAPYFRIFNPILQSRKFDENGDYIKRFIPELRNLDKKYIHAPFEAKKEELEKAHIKIGENYPHPMIDLKEGRERALKEYKKLGS